MGQLKYANVDLNNTTIVRAVISAVQKELDEADNYCSLEHVLPSYFATPGRILPSTPGWYIILEAKTPIYVGEAQNLNTRLNTPNGSCDDFGRKARTSDSQRNFIKKMQEVRILGLLRVAIISQPSVITSANLGATPFSDMDRKNIEKLINIHRSMLKYK